jgi:hypothetical protein
MYFLRDIYGYPMNIIIVGGAPFALIAVVLFTMHTISENKKIRLKAEGKWKWEEPKVEKTITNEPEAPKPNTKVILSIGLLALILFPGIALLLRLI